MRVTVLENDISRIVELAKAGKRDDNRAFDEVRDFTLEVGKFENAESSAIVTLGDTKVVSGIKMEVGKPYPDSQDEGSISIGAELLPLSHSEYEMGQPTPDEIEVARVVDRAIRESKSVDLTSLCIKEGEASWTAYFDFYSINSNGNLFDAGSIAGLAAFLTAKIPKIDEKNKIIDHEYAGKIALKRHPLLTTFVKVGGKILVDPTYIEEKAAEARYSVGTTEDGLMCAMQKGMNGSFTVEEVNYIIDLAFKVGGTRRAKLMKILKM